MQDTLLQVKKIIDKYIIQQYMIWYVNACWVYSVWSVSKTYLALSVWFFISFTICGVIIAKLAN